MLVTEDREVEVLVSDHVHGMLWIGNEYMEV